MEFPTVINWIRFKGCWLVVLMFIQILIDHSVRNSGQADQTPHSVKSDLVLHCLPMSHKRTLGLYGLKQGNGEKATLTVRFVTATK